MSDEWKKRLISILFTLAVVALIGLLMAPLPLWTPEPTPTAEPTATPTVDLEVATSTPVRQAEATAVPTSSLQARVSEYMDTRLCFRVEVPGGWTTDGVRGGFAQFSAAIGEPSYNISNVALDEATLSRALGEVQGGPLGPYVREVKDFVVDGQPALWVAFAPGAQFMFVVMVIAPDCGDGPHALFISATGADQGSFESFLSYVRFISS
jgi:hypothetical protein